ncbi:major facilitator superfamily domain-containing protein [Cladochytrium replicatum]|nr:major facilitator superfamily domain-containing protein [Cladochytrium replicatum]
MANRQSGYGRDEDPVQHDPMTTPRVQLSKFQFIVVFSSLVLAIFLAGLDNTIVAVMETTVLIHQPILSVRFQTAIPTIVTDFQAADLISWVGTGYLLTAAALSPIYGKVADVFGRKLVFLVAIFIFEFGSLLCGLANSMVMLIIGRVVAGIGGGGIFNLVLIIVSDIHWFTEMSLTIPFKRGKYQGIFGGVFGVSNVIGPLAGGAFTDSSATWRWSFYINLPIGGLTFLVVLFFLTLPKGTGNEKSFKEKVFRIDYLGVFLLISAIVALLLPTQLGGTSWSWGAPQTIALFVLSAVLFFIFWLVEYKIAKEPVIPPSMFVNVSVYFSILVGFFVGGSFFSISYYVPLYFQVVQGDSATISGLKSIPMVVGVVAFSNLSGQIISRTGHLVPFFFIGGASLTVGMGLLSTVDEFTAYWKMALMLFVCGVGVGCTILTRVLSAQASVRPSMIAIATSLSGFCQILGGAVGIAIFGAVFSNTVYSELINNFPAAYSNPQLIESLSDAPNSVRSTLASLPNNAFATLFPIYLRAFTVALRYSFYAAIVFPIMIFVSGLFMKPPTRQSNQTKKQNDLESGSDTAPVDSSEEDPDATRDDTTIEKAEQVRENAQLI